MSDSRPEITARADGDRIRLELPYNGVSAQSRSLSPQECFALQCQLSAAMDQVGRDNLGHSLMAQAAKEIAVETWRDREPML